VKDSTGRTLIYNKWINSAGAETGDTVEVFADSLKLVEEYPCPWMKEIYG
jgi:hypothetical protein